MNMTRNLGEAINNISAACAAMGVSRATLHRRMQSKGSPLARPTPPLALTDEERQAVLDVLYSERFQDVAPHEVYATLLDEGVYVYVAGWMVAHREQAALAKRLIVETCERQKIQQGQLTIHADRGSSMTSKPVAFLWPTWASRRHTAGRP